jgi:hypothetical protein
MFWKAIISNAMIEIIKYTKEGGHKLRNPAIAIYKLL